MYEDTDSMKVDTASSYPDREECERIQVSEWPVLCKDGSTKILVVMSDRYTGEILHMFRKEDDIKSRHKVPVGRIPYDMKEHPSSVYGSTKETRDMLRKAELNARYGKAATDGKEAD